MKYFRRFAILTALLLSASLLSISRHPVAAQSISTVLPLLDTQTGTDVGNIEVNASNSQITVTLLPSTSAGCLEATYLYVGATAPGDPLTFPNKHTNLDCATMDTFTLQGGWFGQVYITAYADFSHQELVKDDLSLLTSNSVSMNVALGSNSYLNVNLLSSSTPMLSGQYESWCLDPWHSIDPNSPTPYTANVYYSYGALPDGLVGGSMDGFTENISLVNYVINHTQQYLAQGTTIYDIQTAIWGLIDPTYANQIIAAPGTPIWTIYQDAHTNGYGYVPGCGELVGVILEPIENDAQHQFIAVPVPCSNLTVFTHAATTTAIFDLGAVPTNTPTYTATPTSSFGCQKHNADRLDCSSLQVTGMCSGSTAVFTITNTGEPGDGDMLAPTQWRLVDVVSNTIVQTGTVLLTGGSAMTVTYDGTQQVRLEADQQIGHPGQSLPQTTLMCSTSPISGQPSPSDSSQHEKGGNNPGKGKP